MKFNRLKRREFIAALGGAAAAWPLAARAQQPMPVIGFLGAVSPDGFVERLRAFREGLKEAGYVEGENVAIEYRWAENQLDRLPALAAELVRKRVAVIVAHGGTAPTIAAKAATTTIPIVFVIPEDPVKLGLVASLSRPGGNLTGVNFLFGELVPKRLELLRELVPAMTRVAVFVNPANPARAESIVNEAESAGRMMGLHIQVFNTGTAREINAAFATLARERPDALFVSPDPFFQVRRVQLATLAARHGIPTSFSARGLRRSGRPDELRAQHQRRISSSRRLYRPRPQGREAGGLAGAAVDQFELVINTQTAMMLGLTVPPIAARDRRRGDRLSARIKRREFITLLGGAAAAPIVWPLAARAQPPRKVPRIGVSPCGHACLLRTSRQGLPRGAAGAWSYRGKNGHDRVEMGAGQGRTTS